MSGASAPSCAPTLRSDRDRARPRLQGGARAVMSLRGALGRLLRWQLRIRTRLLLVNVLIVAVPVAGLAFARFYEREMLAAVEKDMIHQAEVLRAALGDDIEAGREALGRARAPAAHDRREDARAHPAGRRRWPRGRRLARRRPPEGVEHAPPFAGPTPLGRAARQRAPRSRSPTSRSAPRSSGPSPASTAPPRASGAGRATSRAPWRASASTCSRRCRCNGATARSPASST